VGTRGDHSKRDGQRPDWHMRWPFALAYLVLVVAAFVVDWRVGLALLAWLPAAYLWRKLLAWLRSQTQPPNRLED
jgi:hypothetical protein